ncbi:hypothetical protein WME76_40540 [Sorangium sp. So ce119]|uniref:hypothetical protein n=1 Tax=Sorangium sp. So ce119 TaxID=3133279 RepID=UPI003F5FF004
MPSWKPCGTGQALVRPSGPVRFDLADAEPPADAADHVDAARERYGPVRTRLIVEARQQNQRARSTV